MPDAYNPWGAPVFPTADDNAMQPEPVATSLLSQIAGLAGRAPLSAPAQPEMRAAEYTPTQRIGNAVSDALQYLGMQPYTANDLTSRVGNVLMGSPLGVPASAADAVYAKSRGDNLGTVQAMAGMLPGVGPEARAAASEVRQGIRAYHGSPHDFDKFDLSKIGTGEGAQAYGHGLYFADKEGTAKAYRDALAPMRVTDAQGRPPMNDIWGEMTSAARQAAPDVHYSTANQIAEDIHSRMRNGDDLAAFRQEMEQSQKLPQEKAMYRAALDQGQKYNVEKTGHMYEVNINADPSHFLDWDKPLSQQPEVFSKLPPDLQETAKQYAGAGTSADEYATGQSLWRTMARPSFPIRDNPSSPWKASNAKTYDEALGMVGGDKSRVNKLLTPDPTYNAQALNQAGIPGIKYLDQGSRGAGQGSSNYVVFNHDIIDIMRKYAVPGMLGAPILANALSEQKT